MKLTAFAITGSVLLAVIPTVGYGQPPARPGDVSRQGSQPAQARRVHPLIGLFDKDKDGVLSKEEIDGAAAKLNEFDRSKDGKLTSEELRGQVRLGPGGPGRGGPSASEYENPLLPKDDDEKKVLAGLEEMRKGPRFANVSTSDGRLLRQLTEAIDAKRVVEIGTSTGESAVWFALGLRKTGGKLFTHEIDPQMVKVATENFKKVGVDDLITIIEGDAHETVKQHKEPIDILFLDADKAGYIDYLKKLLPLVRPGGLLIAHNMRHPNPDPAYIKAITQDPKLETSFLLMEGAGVGVTLKKR